MKIENLSTQESTELHRHKSKATALGIAVEQHYLRASPAQRKQIDGHFTAFLQSYYSNAGKVLGAEAEDPCGGACSPPLICVDGVCMLPGIGD